MGQIFGVFQSSRPPGAGVWRHVQIWRRKLEFPEIAQKHNFVGSSVQQDTLFSKSDGVTAPNMGCEVANSV